MSSLVSHKATKSSMMKECKLGPNCEHFKKGQCKFSHGNMLKAQPIKQMVVKDEKPQKNIVSIVREFAKRHALLSRQVAIANVDNKIKESYVDLKSTTSKEKWSDMPETVDMLKEQMSMMRTAARTAIGRKIVRTSLWSTPSSITSGASAFNQSVVALTPIGVQDWSGFAALYDEAKVAAVNVHCRADGSAGASVNPVIWGFALDPSDAGVYSNVADVFTAVVNSGPIALIPATAAPGNAGSTTTHGLLKLHMALHGGRLTSSVTTGAVGGGWFSTDSSGLSVGFLKCGIPSIGGTGTSTFSYAIEYITEFRDRT